MKLLGFITIVFSLTTLCACGTVNGFGEDVAAAGKDIQKISATGAKKENK